VVAGEEVERTVDEDSIFFIIWSRILYWFVIFTNRLM